MSDPITGKELVNFSGWDIDSFAWDEIDRFDPKKLAEAVAYMKSERDLDIVFDFAKPEPSLEPPDLKEAVMISGDFLPDCVGKYEKPGPNRRKFKRNARRQRK